MKKINLRKLWISLPHMVFWFISVNLWNVVLNPGVESIGVFGGMVADWDTILLLNTTLLIYISLPFIWLARNTRVWIKIVLTILFITPIGYVILQAIRPNGDKEIVDIFVDYFLRNFMYVIVFHLTIVAACYLHVNGLIRRFLNQSYFKQYLLRLTSLIAGAAILNFSVYNFCLDKLFPSLYYISYFKIWELVLIIAAYLIFTGGLFLTGQYARMLIEKREAARNELSALKAQINPHFLFNNLNTIYSMASQNDQRTPDVILKLSDFLRYVLYDTASEFIPLEKEIEMMKTYVGLQKERLNPQITQIELETSGNFSGIEIAPLLLLPLAENCFKHGVGKNPGTIRISIAYDGKMLTFCTENQIAPREKADITENGGLGIPNVEKRLNLIYPECHSIDYQEKNDIFNLKLKVELTKNQR